LGRSFGMRFKPTRLAKSGVRVGRTALRLFAEFLGCPGEYCCTPPVIVLAFNRPHYLQPTLESLRNQTPPVDERRIHLFQDGAVNLYSGKRYSDDATVQQCIEIFRCIFPGGQVHASSPNIGICENFLRAERFAFETLKAPVAYFFEDDMVLSRHYVSALDTLRRALCGRRVGYFNACGSFRSTVEEQSARRTELIDMGHLWAFGLKRSHWQAMQPKLASYYKLVVGRDYMQRPHRKIRARFRKWGISHPASSQDAAKTIATHILGNWQASSFPCLAQYIGKQGVHFNEALFEGFGLHQTNLYPGELPRPRISRQVIRAGIKERQIAFKRVFLEQEELELRQMEKRASASARSTA